MEKKKSYDFKQKIIPCNFSVNLLFADNLPEFFALSEAIVKGVSQFLFGISCRHAFAMELLGVINTMLHILPLIGAKFGS